MELFKQEMELFLLLPSITKYFYYLPMSKTVLYKRNEFSKQEMELFFCIHTSDQKISYHEAEYSESLVKFSVSTTFGKSRSVSVSTTNKFSSLDQSRSRNCEIRVSVSMMRLVFSLVGLSLETMILVSLFTAMSPLFNRLSQKFLF